MAAGCNSPAGPGGTDTPVQPADSPYVLDLSTGESLWGDNNEVTPNDDDSVTITYMTGKDWPAWGINFYTGAASGMDLTGYGTMEIVWEAEYPAGTAEEDTDGPNKQIKSTFLCGGLDSKTNKELEKYNGVETKTTTTIDLSPAGDFTAADKQNVQQLVLQAKIPGTTLTIYSITFNPIKNIGPGNSLSGPGAFSSESSAAKTVVTYQGKTDVVKIISDNYDAWGPIRVDLSDYAEKEVRIDVSMNMWLETASKIMWQVNDEPTFTVITGGNDSYPQSQWVEFTGSKTVTLPPVEKDGDGNVTGCPWFYLNGRGSDGKGLQDGSAYYIADFELTVSVLE
jgi:hypothetical protein